MNRNPEEELKQKRLLMIYFGIALAIQVIVLFIYYFREGQTQLAFPMLLGIFISSAGLVTLSQFGKRQ